MKTGARGNAPYYYFFTKTKAVAPVRGQFQNFFQKKRGSLLLPRFFSYA